MKEEKILSTDKIKVNNCISNFLKKIQPQVKQINKVLQEILLPIKDYYSTFECKNIPPEKLKHFTSLYKLYGSYGWSVPMNGTSLVLNYKPRKVSGIDRFMVRFFTKKNVEKSFKYLKTFSYFNCSDIEESYWCYKNKHYKACCLLLFSLVDSLIIKLEKQKETGRRSTNKNIEKIKKFIDNSEEEFIFYACKYYSTYESLLVMYKNGEDFKNQPQVINRNFLSHGMLIKTITKIDCLKVLNLLESVCFLIKKLKVKVWES